jgi:hypothetical protein
MRIHRAIVLLLSVGLLAGIAVGTLPTPEQPSQPVSETGNTSSAIVQNASSLDAQSQQSAAAQRQPALRPEIIPEDHIDVPEQTVTLGGETYDIKLIGRAETEGNLEVFIEGPGNSGYSSALVDARGPPSDVPADVSPAKRGRGNSRPSFATTGIPPGLYFVGVREQNSMRAVQPVVIAATETSLSGPNCVGAGSSAVFEVYVNEGQAGNVGRVEVVAFNQNQTIRTTAERERANLYRADISFEGAPQSDMDMLVHAKVYAGNGQGNSGNAPGNSGNAPGNSRAAQSGSQSLRNVIGISQQHTIYVVQNEANCG